MSSIKEALTQLKVAIDGRALRASDLRVSNVYHLEVRDRRREQAATESEVIQLLGRLSLHYPQPALSVDQHKLRWEDYLRDLRGFTVGEIEGMISRWRNSQEYFFPTPGQLKAKRFQ